MIARIRVTSGSWIGLLLLLVSAAPLASAEAPNATVVGGNIQLFKSYPNFAPSTLLRFRLSPGEALTVIPNGARVQVSAVKVVSSQEWFEITYSAAGRTYVGWMYGGDVGRRRYLRLDDGVERRLSSAAAPAAGAELVWSLVGALVGPSPLQAQGSVGPPVAVPPVRTDPLLTLAIAAAYIVVFLGAMFVVKRWLFPTSNAYTFMMSFAILLLLGAITQTVWADLIGVALAQGSP